MYLVTNRNIEQDSGSVEKVFSKRPNQRGPNELRVAKVVKKNKKWCADVLDDLITKTEIKKINTAHNLNIDQDSTQYIDLKVASDLVQQARTEKRNILFFVHGYNNNVQDVLTRAESLENEYGVLVLPFTWPANGGGIKGVADYKDDKNDAKISTVALDRFLCFIEKNLRLITEANLAKFWQKAQEKHPNDPEKRDSLYSELVSRDCPFTLNIMFHSMGNYLLKQLLKSSISKGTGLMFDNVVLASADTNNLDHVLWTDRIQFRKRLYITINEDDKALAASRIKSGQDQLARLGHVLIDLQSTKAQYVNFSNASYVGSSHAYFEGSPCQKNPKVKAFFKDAFNGKSADNRLRYRADKNYYELK